ncbi:glycoside hydrolase family 105 protein [Asticcacaulis sp. YBE204]|uniref:glycoside hydrolase family 88/105 protein n=1 Tax=Asticcacaulis sp. YBE204 TaxID=1282363 RepID=UPI0003C3ADF7|nr:glycoside hydrolase family 88 protein [Asticcacaulis sp. YBE204]ESQ79118.1 hypothetical protein AEYBE204_10715 [Asticcacaulis sp. YBE204]
MTLRLLKSTIFCFAVLTASQASAQTPAPVPETARAVAANAIPFDRKRVIALAEKAADYQIAAMAGGDLQFKKEMGNPTGWVQGAFFVSLIDLADRSDAPIYGQLIRARGKANGWALGPRLYHADDHVIGQSYFWAARHGDGEVALKPMRDSFDKILAAPSTVDLKHGEYTAPGGAGCDTRWCWADAIFMAPAAWLEMSKVTGDPKYAAFAKSEFRAVTEYLFDKDEHLYYRDSRFFDRRGPNGEKVFWSRGDGWVLAGLARMIALLPEGDPDRAYMVGVFKQMAAKIKAIQKADGYWAPSLLADPKTALPESSGTGFYTYALAWGVKAGILDRKAYEPSIRKGWAALARSVHADGRLGYVQQVSDRPDSVGWDDTQFYGVGAFVLAATAVADLDLDKPVVKKKR